MKNKQIKSTLIFVAGVVSLVLLVIIAASNFESSEGVDQQIDGELNSQDSSEFYQVVHVFDGDTFSVRMNNKTEVVRVMGIDSPETGEKYTEKECFSKESSARAVELLNGKRVRLEADSTQADRDKYNRLLRYVFLEGGIFFNQTMIEEGFAKEYTYNNLKYKYQEDFLSAQQKAKEDDFGMWSKCER